jgi:hypothetical protein
MKSATPMAIVMAISRWKTWAMTTWRLMGWEMAIERWTASAKASVKAI